MLNLGVGLGLQRRGVIGQQQLGGADSGQLGAELVAADPRDTQIATGQNQPGDRHALLAVTGQRGEC